MTLAWRINAISALFAAGWIVVALAVERSELLFQPTGLRVAVGVLLALVGEGVEMVRHPRCPVLGDGPSGPDVPVASGGNADGLSPQCRVLGASLAPRATKTGNTFHHLPVAERQAPLMSAAFATAKEASSIVRRYEDVASTRAALTPERVWTKARGMVHNEMPDYESDRAYLSLVRSAANGGHPEALRKLGEYAFRRGSCVEAAYWEFQACRHGATEDDGFMDMYAEQWVENGCPDEDEFVCEAFTPEQSSFGRSVLRFHSGTDVSLALGRFAEKARAGNADAAAFLKWAGAE